MWFKKKEGVNLKIKNQNLIFLGRVYLNKIKLYGKANTEYWMPEIGYKYFMVLIKPGKNKDNIVVFDSQDAKLSLSYVDNRPFGVAPCLNSDFKGANDQRIPIVIQTYHIELSQIASADEPPAECYGLVFCVPENDDSYKINYKGYIINLEQLEFDKEKNYLMDQAGNLLQTQILAFLMIYLFLFVKVL